MIKLQGEKVKHSRFGIGTVVKNDETRIVIDFQGVEKTFVFPDIFENFLEIDNLEAEIQIRCALILKKTEKQRKEEERKLQYNRKSQNTVKENNSKRVSVQPEQFVRENIAFKCNYCDGGKSYDQLGYSGVCSDDVIVYNIEIGKKSWCTQDDCYCKQYYEGIIDRDYLDELCMDGGYVCYESQMFRNWKAMAGMYTSGKKKGEPMKIRKVQNNSLAVLTTRTPSSKEFERIIFGVFLVDQIDEGDDIEESCVGTKSKFKLKLSEEEAHKMLFWKYHANKSKPEKAQWSSGLHRYLSDNEAALILRDIALVKANTCDSALAVEFFEYFCEVNGIDIKQVGEPKGALSYAGVVK